MYFLSAMFGSASLKHNDTVNLHELTWQLRKLAAALDEASNEVLQIHVGSTSTDLRSSWAFHLKSCGYPVFIPDGEDILLNHLCSICRSGVYIDLQRNQSAIS